MKVDKKILDKVRKLLAKANDPACTQEEMEAFMAKATKLQVLHGIESSSVELNVQDIDKEYIKANRATGPKEDKNFEGNLLHMIAKHNNCRVLWSSFNRKIFGYTLIGTLENREMAIEMFNTAAQKFRDYAWIRYKEYQKEEKAKWFQATGEKKGHSYLEKIGVAIGSYEFCGGYLTGAISGLNERLRKEKEEGFTEEEKEAWGLIVVKHTDLVDEYVAEKYRKLGRINTTSKKTAPEGYIQGYKDGKSHSGRKELNA